MVLVDTTVWIDLFNKKENEKVLRFEELIGNSEDICICGIIITEILQGIQSDKQFNHVQEILNDLIYLETTKDTYILAAQIYRNCRKSGYTIRKSADCLIAAISMEKSTFLLHNDRDFDYISSFFPLQKA
jgi:predicted nucleic acid-binding protein